LEDIKSGAETKKWDDLIAAMNLNMSNMEKAMVFIRNDKEIGHKDVLGTGLFSKKNEVTVTFGGYKKKRTNKRRSIKKIKKRTNKRRSIKKIKKRTIRGRKRRTRRK
jgi:hypothetical protein